MNGLLTNPQAATGSVPQSVLLAQVLQQGAPPVYNAFQGGVSVMEKMALALMEKDEREKAQARDQQDSDFISRALSNSFSDLANPNLQQAPDGRVYDPSRAQDPALAGVQGTPMTDQQRLGFVMSNLASDPRTLGQAGAMPGLAEALMGGQSQSRAATPDEIAAAIGATSVPMGTTGTFNPQGGVTDIQYPPMTDVQDGESVRRVSAIRAASDGLPRSQTPQTVANFNEAPPKTPDQLRADAAFARTTKAEDDIFNSARERANAAVGIQTELSNMAELVSNGLNTGSLAEVRQFAAGFVTDLGVDREFAEAIVNTDLAAGRSFERSQAALAGQFIKVFGGARPTDADLKQAQRLVARLTDDPAAVFELIQFGQGLAQRDLTYYDEVQKANAEGRNLLEVESDFMKRYGRSIDIDALVARQQEQAPQPGQSRPGQAQAQEGVFTNPAEAPQGATLVPAYDQNGQFIGVRVKQ